MRLLAVPMCLAVLGLPAFAACAYPSPDVMVAPPPPPPPIAPAPPRDWYAGVTDSDPVAPAPVPVAPVPVAAAAHEHTAIPALRASAARDLNCPPSEVVAQVLYRADTGKAVFFAEGCARRAIYVPVLRDEASGGRYLLLTGIVPARAPDPE
jgi:hypothetical protein